MYIMHESEIDWLSWKESLNSDGQQFHQCQQIPHTLTHWTQKYPDNYRRIFKYCLRTDTNIWRG